MKNRVFNLYLVIIFMFNFAHSFFFATYVVFLVSKGMDLLQINIINGFFMVGVFLLEMPTGAYSDLKGRKNAFVISCFCFSLSGLVYYLSSSFWMFVVAEIICSVHSAFYSGALESWVVDSLKFHGYKGDLHKLFQEKLFKKEQQVSEIAIALGALIGGYFATYDLALPWLLSSAASAAIGIICIFIMQENGHIEKGVKINLSSIRRVISESAEYGVKNKSVLYIVCFSAVFIFICQALNMQWQIVFKKKFELDTFHLGWIFVGIRICMFIASYFSVWFLRIFKNEKQAIILSQVITATGILFAAKSELFLIVLLSFLTHEFGRGIYQPLKKSYIHHRIPSEKRNTIVSFDSMVSKFGAFLGLIISGYIAKNYSISAAWIFSGSVLLVSIPIFLKLKNGE